jgi:EAL domain-containing protein (putative c-di-GMP-specific phosphodiesterase class I)
VVMIDTLRHAGSKVSIDDFGTGFSNLSYLKRLPIDAVKIDQAFVRNINVDPSDAAIINGVVAMAKHLNIDTIAEGIETAEQLECLRLIGCRRGQGYYFSKPLPPAHCRALLEQMGEMRRFTETLKLRAFKASKELSPT